MAMHALRTGSIRYVKLVIFVISAYFLTLGLIVKCIPMYTGDSDAGFGNSNTNKNKSKTEKLSKNREGLTWTKDNNVIFKRVGSAENRINEEFVDVDDNKLNCLAKEQDDRFRKLHDGGVYAYTAFYDNRTGDAVIGIFTVVRKTFQASKRPPFWCHFPVFNHSLIYRYAATSVHFYEMCENHKRDFGGWMLTCKVPTVIDQIPEEVIVGYGDKEKQSFQKSRRICVKSRHKRVTRRKLTYGVCVPPLYGNIQPKALLEFVEFHRIIGVDVFTVYVEESNNMISEEVESVLKFYETRNIMKVVRWQLPVKTKSIWYHGQSLAINDCLYRNMYDFRFIAFLDVDEFLVPHGNLTTLNDVIGQVKHTNPLDFSNAGGFIFKSTLYSEEFSRSPDKEEVKVNVQTNRTKCFSFFRHKVMVRPERLLEMGIHHISRSWPDTANYSAITVSPATAHVHHYRNCVQEFGVHCESWLEDLTMPVKYGKTMVDNYLKTIHKVMVLPERLLEMGIHHISRSWPDTANYSAITVSPATAHVHHYRNCVQEFGVHCESWLDDLTMPAKYGKTMAKKGIIGLSFFRHKVMVLPERLLEMGIHHISRSWPDTANYSAITVSPATAHVHHYRNCVQEFGVHCES